MKWSITNLIWLPAGQSQREAKMVFPQSQWSDSLTKRSAGSVPSKVPFPWWFSQRRKNTSFLGGCQKDMSHIHFGVFLKDHMIMKGWRRAVEFHLFFMAIWGLKSYNSSGVQFDHDLGKSTVPLEWWWPHGLLLGHHPQDLGTWFWVWWSITVIMYPDTWMKLGLWKIGLLDISW